MGFLDKAKKMAEQAQVKLDEAQKQFNQQPGQPGGGPIVEYDKHGRPIQSQPPPPAPAPPGPAAAAPPMAAPAAPAPGPTAPPPVADASMPAEIVEETVGHGDAETAPGPPPDSAPSAHPGAQGVPQDRNRESYEAPKMSSGDPLAG